MTEIQNINDLPNGSTFYAIRDYEIKFKCFGEQYYGVTRGKNPYMLYKVEKASDDAYKLTGIVEGYGEEIECSTRTISKNDFTIDYNYGFDKEELIAIWYKDFKEIMQRLRDYVNNIQTDDNFPDIDGIDVHENWIMSPEKINRLNTK